MKISISYNGVTCDEITIEKTCLGGLNLCQNQIRKDFLKNTDNLQVNDGYTMLTKALPNNLYIVLLICELSDELYEKYKGLTALSASFDGVSIEAVI